MNNLILVLCFLLFFVACIFVVLGTYWVTVIAFITGAMFLIIAIHSRKNKD